MGLTMPQRFQRHPAPPRIGLIQPPRHYDLAPRVIHVDHLLESVQLPLVYHGVVALNSKT